MKRNFKKANEISKEICKKIKSISPLSKSDIDLYYKFFQKDRYTYGNGWSYVTQAMNRIGRSGLGYKVYDGKNLISFVVYPNLEYPKKVSIYFIRPMGENPLKTIVEIEKKLRGLKIIYPIYVKKIFNDQKELLMKEGYKNISFLPWHSEIIAEDDTYPELIIDPVVTLRELENKSRNHSLRQSFRDAETMAKRNKIEIKSEGFEKYAYKITQQFFKFIQSKKGKDLNISTSHDYYNMIYNNPNRPNLIKELVYVDGKPLGYYVIEETSNKKYSNLYALIILRNVQKRLSDYTMFHLIRNLNTKYLNMGGSEDEGLDNYKRKFQPVKEIKMHWVVKKY